MIEDVPAPPFPEGVYVPNEIVLYGVKLTEIAVSRGDAPASEKLTMRVQLFPEGAPQKPSNAALAAVYSYSFEGHCYRMDRPRIFLMNGVSDQPAIGCGYSHAASDQFRMWRVKAQSTLVELSAMIDTTQKLILDAQLPGKRAPNTYNDDMQLAHRGGRLTRSAGP
jgi:hypothetical protein